MLFNKRSLNVLAILGAYAGVSASTDYYKKMVKNDPLLSTMRTSMLDTLGIDLASKSDMKVAIETQLDEGVDVCALWESWLYETEDSEIKWEELATEDQYFWVKDLVYNVDLTWHDNMFVLYERALTMDYINADI